MHTEIELPDRVREYLEGLDVPVRVLRGNTGNFRPSPSWRGQARDNGATIDQCEADGLTIVSWATEVVTDALNPPVDYVSAPPADLFVDGNVPDNAGRDWVVPMQPCSDNLNYCLRDGNGAQRVYARLGGQRTLWYHFPLDSTFGYPGDSLDVEKVFGEPIERARTYDPDAERREQERAAAADQFRRMVTSSHAQRIATLERDTEQGMRDQRVYEQQLATQIATNVSLNSQLEALRNYDESQDEARVEAMWAALNAHPKIEGIRADNRWIILTTSDLDLTDPRNPDRSCYLGKFDIRIGAPGSGNDVRFNNLTNKQEVRWDHPHVEDGHPCLGNSQQLFSELQANGEILGLLEVCFQYLETWNPEDSWGHHARYWFDAAARGQARTNTQGRVTAVGNGTGEEDYDPNCGCSYCTEVTAERRQNGNA